MMLTMLFSTQLYAAAKLQDADFKTLTQLTNAGGSAAQLLNDTKVYVTANGINQQLSSAIQSGLIGGGAGQNLVSNGNFEASGVAGWSTFQTTLSAAPSVAPTTAPATCSSCTFAIGAQSSGALDGATSLQLTGASTTTAGQGFISNAFTVAPAFRGQVMSIKGVFGIVSGLAALNLSGTASNSFAVYIYDVTNAAWIQPNGTYGLASNGGQFAPISFQVPSNTTQLQLAVVNVNAISAASTLLFDDITIAPQTGGYGLAGSDFKSTGTLTFTATTTAPTKGTTTADSIGFARVGDWAHVLAGYKQTTNGTIGAGDILVQMPAGLSFDSNKVTFLTGAVGNGVSSLNSIGLGTATIQSGTYVSFGVIIPYDATHFRVYTLSAPVNSGSAGGGMWGAAFPLNSSPLSFTADFFAPIAGWSSNVTQSSDFDGRNVTFQGFTSAGQSVAANGPVPVATVVDRGGAWTGSAYTVQAAGDYAVQASYISSATPGNAYLAVNGASVNIIGSTVSAGGANSVVSGTIAGLKVNDVITVRTNTATTVSSASISISRVPGSSPVLQASSTVVATYGLTAAQSPGSGGILKYDTKIRDTNNAYSPLTGLFTCPTSGQYRASVVAQASNNNTAYLLVRLNNGPVGAITEVFGGTSLYSGTLSVYCQVGQTLGIYSDPNAVAMTFGAPVTTGVFLNQVTFERTGN